MHHVIELHSVIFQALNSSMHNHTLYWPALGFSQREKVVHLDSGTNASQNLINQHQVQQLTNISFTETYTRLHRNLSISPPVGAFSWPCTLFASLPVSPCVLLSERLYVRPATCLHVCSYLCPYVSVTLSLSIRVFVWPGVPACSYGRTCLRLYSHTAVPQPFRSSTTPLLHPWPLDRSALMLLPTTLCVDLPAFIAPPLPSPAQLSLSTTAYLTFRTSLLLPFCL